MEPERWERLEAIYHAACRRPATERDAFLAEACAGDPTLREEVEALVAKDEQPGSFIDRPVFDLGVRVLAEERTMFGAGETIGHYVILDVIGRGGMGEVYLARDPRLDRKVALKLLPPDLQGDADRVRRFRQEARAASAVSHPNIAHVYDIGEAERLFYTAIEYVDGVTLRQLIHEGKLDLRGALDITIQIAEALAAAHAAGVVHRDVKPENVMVRRDGYVKVLDFGLAKFAEHLKTNAPGGQQATTAPMLQSVPGAVMGTVSYMSPEQARGKPVGASTDVWSLGMVLYEMLAGRRPFEGETMSDILVSILEREPEPLACLVPGVPAEVQLVVTKALAKNPASRYRGGGDMAAGLRRGWQRLEPVNDGRAPGVQARQDASATILMETGGQAEAVSPAHGDAARTAPAERARRTSSVESIISGMKRRKGTALVAAAVLILMAGSILYGIYRLEDQNEANVHLNGVEVNFFLPEGVDVSCGGPNGSCGEFEVTLAGEKRMLDRVNVHSLTALYVDVTKLTAEPRRTIIRLSPGRNVSMNLPAGVRIKDVYPDTVDVYVMERDAPAP